MAIVLSLVVLALANFVAADLRYTQVVNARAETLSTAESGIDYAVARLRANQTLCATNVACGGPVGLERRRRPDRPPGPLNDSVTTLTCERSNAGFAAVAGWSVIVTNGSHAERDQGRHRRRTGRIVGPIYVSDPATSTCRVASDLFSSDGDIWYQRTARAASPLPAVPLSNAGASSTRRWHRGPICTPADWDDIVLAAASPRSRPA